RRHDLRLRATLRPWSWMTVGAVGRLTSGARLTPRVDGDVNGDGTRNDPAFVFDPAATSDTALAGGMSRLLRSAPGSLRACLRRQLGRIAGRNSCRAGWTSALDLRADLQFARSSLGRRLRVSVTTANALSLVDRVLHGRDRRGWGEPGLPDPVLLRVRGFDPADLAFLYEVNPGFGTVPAGGRFQRPFTITLEARVTVGSDPAHQPLDRLINQTAGPGRSADELREELSRRLPNLPAQVVSVDSALRLGLTPEQRARLLQGAEALGARLAPLADSIALTLSDVENGRHSNARAGWREIDALARRIRAALDEELRAIRAILTAQQWEKLPEAIRTPSRQLVPPRRTSAASSW
ncbi:MAG TPA: hypothetical protein VF179_02910, partial [Thermoanaerobaculia bacterium]|nr:hypothetical protein [Thermoanaerobaculia bacterium]